MTEQQTTAENTPTPGEEPPQGATGTPGTTTDTTSTPPAPEVSAQQPEDTEGKATNTEAARYRVRARTAESERDAIKAELTGLKRAAVERLAADRLAVAADLFDLTDTTLEDLLAEDGAVSTEKVATALDALVNARPGLARTDDTTRNRHQALTTALHQPHESQQQPNIRQHERAAEDARLAAVMPYLDAEKFHDESGGLDEAKVRDFHSRAVSVSAGLFPDLGGGNRGTATGNGTTWGQVLGNE